MNSAKPTKKKKSSLKQFLITIGTLIAAIVVSTTVFVFAYGSYTDEVLYNERLKQMQEVTGQLFGGIEDVIDTQWYNVDTQKNRLSMQDISTLDELVSFMSAQSETSNLSQFKVDLIAVTDNDRFITQNGANGFLNEMESFSNEEDKISFVSIPNTSDLAQMYFLEKLDSPLAITEGERNINITYYGISRSMDELNKYFVCNAYDKKNAIYVVDNTGAKLFSGNNGEEFLEGYNVFKQLSDASYLHNSSFDDAYKGLAENGLSYSNAVLNGNECYYAMYRMQHSSWILLFVIPSSAVAVNTVSLVHTTTIVVLAFAVAMIVALTLVIYLIINHQQKQTIRIYDETNSVLEENNKALLKAQEDTQKALEVAKNASRAKTEFLANMSHDIRTPMNAIVGIEKLMEYDLNNPDKMKLYIHKLEISSQHLLGLINDVFDMSKIESAGVTLNNEPVNLAEQVAQIDSILRPQVGERQQHFKISVNDIKYEQFIGDAVRLRQILINLLSNAIKYTPDGGSIDLLLSERPGKDDDHEMLEIVVKDTGYGISKDFLEHIFEPFTRQEGSITNKVQGTGLGLAITKSIVDLMGGRISVQSELNKGSCFRVILPMKIDKKSKIEVDAKNVLLISKDEQLTKNATSSFSNSSVSFNAVSSKEEAETLLNDTKMDIILLSGFLDSKELPDLVSFLHEKAKDALLVFCVEYTEQDETSEFLKRSGVNGLIARPFFLTNFARIVKQVHSEMPLEELAKTSSLNGKRFLCAEDNALNAEILSALLEMNGASCLICQNGKELVDTFANVKEGEYDAILMDVQMPVMNGLDATRAIRSGINPLGKEIPIIAMTANAFSSDVQECLDAGMDAHIAKPLDISILIRTMKNLSAKK